MSQLYCGVSPNSFPRWPLLSQVRKKIQESLQERKFKKWVVLQEETTDTIASKRNAEVKSVWWPWTRAEPGQFLGDTDNVLAREIKTCVDHSNKERQQYVWFVLPDFGGGKVAELSSELRVHLTSYCLERSPLKEATCQGKATPAEWDCQSTILSKSWENSCRSLIREWISHTERQCSAKDPQSDLWRTHKNFPEGENQLSAFCHMEGTTAKFHPHSSSTAVP